MLRALRCKLTLTALTVFATSPLLPPQSITAQRRTSADSAQALHLLNRLAFGPRPGDLDRVIDMGANRWINAQLRADTALDASAITALNGCDLFTEPVATAVARLSGVETFSMTMTEMDGSRRMSRVSFVNSGFFAPLVASDSIARMNGGATGIGAVYVANNQLMACRLTRVESSENQLLEVMTDFWHNHFSLFSGGLPSRGALIDYDRAIIRPNAFGKFRNLLSAVAHSPAMLRYLDNASNTADSARTTLTAFTATISSGPRSITRTRGLNENYARELLELHTLGVDGGYTQNDVIEVARALTGWTDTRSLPSSSTERSTVVFRFDSTVHDAEAKRILGFDFPAGRGVEEGEEIIDMLSRHPATARHIARKLVVRFVSDDPPAALVDRAAATFRATDGDIREVMRTILSSAEFLSPDSHGSKVKSPLEFVLSLRRVLNAPPDTNAELVDFLINLSQPPHGRVSPDGWPEVGTAWMNAGAMGTRLDIITNVAAGKQPSIKIEEWRWWSALVDQSFDIQAEGVIRGILGGQVSSRTREALFAIRPSKNANASANARSATLRDLIGMALGSPEFQRR